MTTKTQTLPTYDEIWNNYQKMIMKIAHKIKKRYDRPFEELVSEGIFSVFKKIKKWNPDRASLCTYIYRCAYFGMLDYCTKNLGETPIDIYNSEYLKKETKPNWIHNFLSEVSEETRQLVKIFFEAPEELHEAIKITRPKTSKKSLRTYMIDAMNWENKQVDRSFKEVSECL